MPANSGRVFCSYEVVLLKLYLERPLLAYNGKDTKAITQLIDRLR
jgi:hypothetical protein